MDKAQEKIAEDEKHAKDKGFDNVIEWYLACLNAEVNILLDASLRTEDRLDALAVNAKAYIVKISKALGYRKLPKDRVELREKVAHIKLAEDEGITIDGVPEYIKCEAIGLTEVENAFVFADRILALIPDEKEERTPP